MDPVFRAEQSPDMFFSSKSVRHKNGKGKCSEKTARFHGEFAKETLSAQWGDLSGPQASFDWRFDFVAEGIYITKQEVSHILNHYIFYCVFSCIITISGFDITSSYYWQT